MKIQIDDLRKSPIAKQTFELGCLIDTNVIFAASFPLDTFNEWSEQVFGELRHQNISPFTNVNVRSEFIELNRQVLVPEGLIAFFDEAQDVLRDEVYQKLRSLKSNSDRANREGRTFKLGDREIKTYRALLEPISIPDFENGWQFFCLKYFHPYITNAWDEAVQALGLKFVGTRAIESREYFMGDPNWKDALDIVGRFGIGSADAMIVNLFLKSKFPLLVTADRQMFDAVETLSDGKKLILTV